MGNTTEGFLPDLVTYCEFCNFEYEMFLVIN